MRWIPRVRLADCLRQGSGESRRSAPRGGGKTRKLTPHLRLSRRLGFPLGGFGVGRLVVALAQFEIAAGGAHGDGRAAAADRTGDADFPVALSGGPQAELFGARRKIDLTVDRHRIEREAARRRGQGDARLRLYLHGLAAGIATVSSRLARRCGPPTQSFHRDFPAVAVARSAGVG